MIKFANQVFAKDNLLLLGELPENKVNLIYSDILYGTGKNFGEYQDLRLDKEEILYHYEPRFKEMRRVLRPQGLTTVA